MLKIVNYQLSAGQRFKKKSKFGYYLRFPLFFFLKGRTLDFSASLMRTFK